MVDSDFYLSEVVKMSTRISESLIKERVSSQWIHSLEADEFVSAKGATKCSTFGNVFDWYTLMCGIVGGIISRRLCCKINTIKERGHNKRGGLVWWEITLKGWGEQKGEGSCVFRLINFRLLINSNFEKKMF